MGHERALVCATFMDWRTCWKQNIVSVTPILWRILRARGAAKRIFVDIGWLRWSTFHLGSISFRPINWHFVYHLEHIRRHERSSGKKNIILDEKMSLYERKHCLNFRQIGTANFILNVSKFRRYASRFPPRTAGVWWFSSIHKSFQHTVVWVGVMMQVSFLPRNKIHIWLFQ